MGLLGGLNDNSCNVPVKCLAHSRYSINITHHSDSYLHSGQVGIRIDLCCLSTETGAHSCRYKPTKPQENFPPLKTKLCVSGSV